MITKTVDKLKHVSPWHFVWISIVASELITAVLSTVQGYLYWGKIKTETLIIGAVDSLVVPLIVATLVVYFVKHTTELHRVNEQLQEANRRLQALDKMKTDFVSVVSHELRTPLTTIKAFVELIMMKPGMPEQRKEKLLKTINNETDRLARLIADLLDLAKIEDASLQWRSEDVSIKEVIMDAIGSMGPLFESKRCSLTTEFNSHLPNLFGDRDRIVQVVTNILSNAVKFTLHGGAIHIAVRAEASPAAQIIVEISDTGMGIAAEDIELIFEKFHRSGDQLTATIEGTGLGLAIARQIVEYHGGRIWATSAPGKGSIFYFTLPLAGRQEQTVSKQH